MSARLVAAARASAPAISRIRKLWRSSSSAAMRVCRRSFICLSVCLYRLSTHDRQPRFDGSSAVDLVDDVDTLVTAVGTGDAEEDREPAPEAEPPLLRELAREDEL